MIGTMNILKGQILLSIMLKLKAHIPITLNIGLMFFKLTYHLLCALLLLTNRNYCFFIFFDTTALDLKILNKVEIVLLI
jgi:hypothetical protein